MKLSTIISSSRSARSTLAIVAQILCTTNLALADQIKYLAHGKTALATRLLEIRGAQKSIDIATYDFSPCNSGVKLLTDDLVAKSNAGVHVRFLVDARNVAPATRANLQTFFSKNKIEFKLYNDGFLAAQNLRTHVKLQIVDGQSYIVGGRNLEAAYFGFDPERNYIDREAFVQGESVQAAQKYFNELWNSPKTMKPRPAKEISEFERSCFADTELDKKLSADIEINGLRQFRAIPTRVCNDVTFHGDNPEFLNTRYLDSENLASSTENQGASQTADPLAQGTRLREKRNSQMHVNFFAVTQSSLMLENWDYMPAHQIDDALSRLRDKNIPILVISNFPEGGDKSDMDVFTAMLDHYERRDNRGSERVLPVCPTGSMRDENPFSSPKARWMIHSKVAVRDQKDVVIGSYNIDERSYDTNLEASIRVINCPALASDVQNETNLLVQNYNQDLVAKKCPRTGPAPLMVRITGWLLSPLF